MAKARLGAGHFFKLNDWSHGQIVSGKYQTTSGHRKAFAGTILGGSVNGKEKSRTWSLAFGNIMRKQPINII